MSAPVKLVFLWLLFLSTISLLGFCDESFNAAHCSQSEREALLKFKHDLTNPSNRLASWGSTEVDCCRWSGVICDNFTGHVLELHLRSLSWEEYSLNSDGTYTQLETYRRSRIGGKISPSILNLKHLRYLDLSNNYFGGIHIPKFLGSMGSLRYLNFSSAGFGGMIPHQLGNLSNLHYLNLYDDYFDSHVENLNWLNGLSSLEFLDLTFVNLSKAINWLEAINTLPSLVELHLSSCQLPHIPPLIHFNFSSLAVLDLSWNSFEGPIRNDLQNMTSLRVLDLSGVLCNSSIPDWVYGLSHLEVLDLGFNWLQGKISNAIGNLTSLITLDLLHNELEGGIPKSFKNLCKLRPLSLSYNKLSQQVTEIFEILSGCVSEGLESLHLYDCQLSGQLTNHLGQFKNLTELDLGVNSISGPIPLSLGEMMSLRFLFLAHNKLNGSLPVGFGMLSKLVSSDISNNSLEGDVLKFHFTNLTKLRNFHASGNQLTLGVGHDWIPPHQLKILELGSWYIGSQFPTWLRSLKYLEHLDLSNSGISTTLPAWFWKMCINFRSLNLSHNHIHGVIPNHIFPSIMVDLTSNHFEGPLPNGFSNVGALFLSNNSFSGSISNFLCHNMHKPKKMELLNLGENLFSGEIPDCWMSWQNLMVIRLSNNKFNGKIPKSIGSLSSLESLHLHNNNLYGEIPSSLQNCTGLVTLNVGGNELVGNIPTWIGERLSSMHFLSLRSNKFHGHIPKELCFLNSLQVLDLAHNSLSGSIPSCINEFRAMAAMNHPGDQFNVFTDEVVPLDGGLIAAVTFMESEFLVIKGKELEYGTIILPLVRVIDLSNNKLCGKIPKGITTLRGLQFLNLSHNFLTGRLPEDMGAMQLLESIDFSLNQLSGEIPQSMLSLTFLSHLNLSYNKLSGKIPLGTQLQSFDPSSYIGNELFGPPLIKNSRVDGFVPNVENGREKDDIGVEVNWFYVSLAPGFVVGFWSVVGPLLFNRRWRYVYFHFLDRLWDKIWWVWYKSFHTSPFA